jgi:hypothetical protein
VAWDGADDRGDRVAPGIYYVSLHAGTLNQVTKIAVVN